MKYRVFHEDRQGGERQFSAHNDLEAATKSAHKALTMAGIYVCWIREYDEIGRPLRVVTTITRPVRR